MHTKGKQPVMNTDTDYQVRATAANGTIRAFAITARDTVEEARQRHNTSPVVTAALGRVLCGAAMMSRMEKEDDDLLTIQVIGDGPMQGLTVTANPCGLLKGFANVTDVEVPPKHKGKLDVGTAVGAGILRVMRDTGAPEPYIGTVQLVSGEIAEDLTYYFAQSEQTPSAVGLGVLVDTDCSVLAAGGFIVQVMPDITDETLGQLEERIKAIPPVTEMLHSGMTPEMILGELLSDMDWEILETQPVAYQCDCSRERVSRSLSILNQKDLQEMIDEGKPIEVRCQFCNETYTFSPTELKELQESAKP